jgi:hypothetical protein
MDQVKAAAGHSVLDRTRREAELEKLPPRDDPMLPGRQRGNRVLASPADQRRHRPRSGRVLS